MRPWRAWPWLKPNICMQDASTAGETTLAALDLGSNSFHMIIARLRPDGLVVLDRLREMVQLGAGLRDGAGLDPAASERALGCLHRFGERLAALNPHSVRAVGTNALREAADAREFLLRAERALGHPIHVISGTEEARLIYAGVAYSRPPRGGRRLVADIGGGSTEFILGRGFETSELASIGVGCVALTERYFAAGNLGARAFAAARLEVLRRLEPLAVHLSRVGWDEAIGASGGIQVVAAVAERLGGAPGGVDKEVLEVIRRRLVGAKRIGEVNLPGLAPKRRSIFAGGLAILAAIFELLGLERMQIADGALREGLLLDLVGRLGKRDVREAGIQQMVLRFRTDAAQGERVANTAAALHAALGAEWTGANREDVRFLDWAARLHELGLTVAHSGYHRHGAYLVENSDMPGFAREEQRRLALLIRAQRKPYPDTDFRVLAKSWQRSSRRLAIILRLAVLLNRARTGDGRLILKAQADGDRIRLLFPPAWLQAHPLSAADLAREKQLLARVGFNLDFA